MTVAANPDFAGLLIFTADVYRRQTQPAAADDPDRDPFGRVPKKDPFGQPTQDPVYSHTLPCRINRPGGGKVMQERARDVVQVQTNLFLDLGADLRETDFVTVKDPEGNVIIDMARVQLVEPAYDGMGEHHRQATISSQRQAS